MHILSRKSGNSSSLSLGIGCLVVLLAFVLVLLNCGSNNVSGQFNGQTGSIRVSISDPPSCAAPVGSIQHVFITIRSVRAHISAAADGSTPGWQELAPQLNTNPVQIDLLGSPTIGIGCLLAILGSNSSLPVGNYQQIRLILVANDGGGGAVPAATTNPCGNGFNCVILPDGSVHELALSSEATTGIKIPPGQVVGGPIHVGPGQAVDLNIDFMVCESLLLQGDGTFRLKPVLTAGQVSANNTGISGQVVDSQTNNPVVGGTVLVALENQDSTGTTDVIFMQTAADASGHFTFCPLPTGATFDVVAVAINGAGVAYNATVVVNVPGGTSLGTIPLTPESGTSTGPATLKGFVTATTGTSPATIDAALSAFHTISLSSGATRAVTIPLQGNSTPGGLLSVQSNSSCPATAPMHSNCAQYTLIVPASNPAVGTFSGGTVSFTPPASGSVPYSVRANAFVPMSTSDCTPPSQTTSQVVVTPGATVTPPEIDFSGCS